jgi:hypothetical protein
MNERRALLLVVLGTVLSVTGGMLGLSAIHASGTVILLGMIWPLILGPYLCAEVVMRYGASGRHHH